MTVSKTVSGKRTTAQRTLLLEIIQGTKGHLDACALYQQARQRQPELSMATVYRNLRLFKELGLIEGHHLDGAHHHYEAKPENSHHHLICLGCGCIREFSCPLTESIKAKIGEKEGFEITEAEVRLAGYCPKCRQLLKVSEADSEPERQLPRRESDNNDRESQVEEA
ncbi:Fur family transcriptional regulator [Chloroflexota bacterium]